MSQLIKATTISFEAIHFKQNASLVSDQMLDTARRQAIAKQQAFKVQNAVRSTSANSDYMTQVRRAFTSNTSSVVAEPVAQASQQAKPVVPANTQGMDSVSTATQQAQSAYTQQRGSFEMRVAKGELSYVPPLVMTVITQYPDVQFEYLGDFQYVPPSSAPSGENVNLSL